MRLPGNSTTSACQRKFPMTGWLVRGANEVGEGRTAVVVRDGNTDHTAKGSRLERLL
jgi:hypothetical protein